MEKVKIAEVIALKNRLKEINALELEKIEWVNENGEVIPINPKIVEEFIYTGLGNVDFITTGFYLEGFSKI